MSDNSTGYATLFANSARKLTGENAWYCFSSTSHFLPGCGAVSQEISNCINTWACTKFSILPMKFALLPALLLTLFYTRRDVSCFLLFHLEHSGSVASGYNRYLWICRRRPQETPDSGSWLRLPRRRKEWVMGILSNNRVIPGGLWSSWSMFRQSFLH